MLAYHGHDCCMEVFAKRLENSQTIPTKVGIQVDHVSRIYAMIALIICSGDYRAEDVTGGWVK
jgi:hypothetical protein